MAPAAVRRRPSTGLVLCLVLALGLPTVLAAAAYDSNTDAEGGSLLTPTAGRVLARNYWFEIPHDPVGVLFMAHGCVHDASDFWPPSPACPNCSGLPEEVAHTKQALARGYAVLAIDSRDRDPASRCFSYPEDKWGVKYILENWTRQYSLQALPIFGLGISAGASFVLRLPQITRMNGIVSEVLGVTYDTFPVENLGNTYPATIFIDMQRDRSMTQRIFESMQKLQQWNVSTAKIPVDPRAVYATFFSDRSQYITDDLSRRIVSGLHRIGMLDNQGFVTADPRYTMQPWRAQLAKLLPDVKPDTGNSSGRASGWALISEQMNVAFAQHEIIGDHLTASLAWLEAQGAVPIEQLEQQLRIGRRIAMLNPSRQTDPKLQDDEALKLATKQVAEQLATTTGKHDNWGDIYAAYVAWLAINPGANVTLTDWRLSKEAGKFKYSDPAQALADIRAAKQAADVAERQAGAAQTGAAQELGAGPQHTAL